MKKRKTISVSFFIILLAVPYLVITYFMLQQQCVKHIMEEKIEKENLHIAVVPLLEAEWIDYPNEMLINNYLFDVKEFYKANGKLIVKGLFDKEETALVQQLIKVTQQKDAKDDLTFVHFFQFLNAIFFQAQQEHNNWQNITAHSFSNLYCIILPKLYLKVPTPPPQDI